MNLSEEQLAAAECPAHSVIVNAAAGSGKTTVLVGYASMRPDERLLYLAFNSSVAKEGSARFPRNVECRTPHSLAFAQFGADYKPKLGNPRAREVMDYLERHLRPGEMGADKYAFTQAALRVVSSFFASDSPDPDIAEDILDSSSADPLGRMDPAKLLRAARLIWRGMQDLGEPLVQMPHDGYLKLYQLSMPDLSRYDAIMLDEAQDTNPCVLNIFRDQETRKVVVGDRHQNIYGFRKSVNAMSLIKGQNLHLTKSFRFGERQAEIANAILGTFCGESVRIEGLGGAASKDNTVCYLHRTNSGLFDKAVDLMKAGMRPHFLGGASAYGLEQISDTWKLAAGGKDVRDPFLRRFKSMKELGDYAEAVDDKEIKSRMSVVKTHGSAIPGLVAQMLRLDAPQDKAHVCLTTAHRSKGLEWDHVILGDDFPSMMVGKMPRTPLNVAGSEEKPFAVEEANLVYVAETRARHKLTESASLAEFTAWAKVA